MAKKILQYPGTDIDVTYDVRKCIHAAECIHGLRSVFNPDAKPWIDPDGASADDVAAVIHACPSGALQYKRKDGGNPEPVPTTNTIAVQKDGPLHVRGDIEIRDHEGSVIASGTRMALCRCGASGIKPFCDNSHNNSGYRDDGLLGRGGTSVPADDEDDNRLVITVAENGFLRVAGEVEIVGTDGETRSINKATLCRCGASGNKPFCDSTHKEIGFTA